ncbi:MAG: hypothetical protein KBA91_03770 [Candidatus Moranbacteria bacterium]|nr:hypothetical protein [Candidatus Moranbacteria bacterium]
MTSLAHEGGKEVRVRIRTAPTHVNGVLDHHTDLLQAWCRLPYMTGYCSPDFPNLVFIPALTVLYQLAEIDRTAAQYWDRFDRGRHWENDRYDGYFVIPRSCCHFIKTLAERQRNSHK